MEETVNIIFAERGTKKKLKIAVKQSAIWRKTKKNAWNNFCKELAVSIEKAKKQYTLCNPRYIFS
jgi:hypothetical protein